VRLIRKRVIATAAAVFVAAWSVIFFQLVSGHDPGLSKSSAAASSSQTPTTSSSSSPAPVTTSQS
jgi:hypothetical protein